VNTITKDDFIKNFSTRTRPHLADATIQVCYKSIILMKKRV